MQIKTIFLEMPQQKVIKGEMSVLAEALAQQRKTNI